MYSKDLGDCEGVVVPVALHCHDGLDAAVDKNPTLGVIEVVAVALPRRAPFAMGPRPRPEQRCPILLLVLLLLRRQRSIGREADKRKGREGFWAFIQGG